MNATPETTATTATLSQPTQSVELPPGAIWKPGSTSLNDGVLCLDVRTPSEFREAHIPGALNVPLGDLGSRVDELRQQFGANQVAVVCRTGMRAKAACEALDREQLHGAQILSGGMVAWTQAGLPVTRGAKAVTLERQVRIAAGTLVLLGVALGFAVHPAFFGLSAFVGAGLAYSGITDTCAMATVLAKMPWNRT